MREAQSRDLIGIVTEKYLSSSDFNGITLSELQARLNIDPESLRELLIPLIEQEDFGVVFASTDINPHIVRLGFEPVDIQIEKLSSGEDYAHACVYPPANHLQKVVDKQDYSDTPYLLELALGEPQLAFRTFDLSVLEHYRNDPRYSYSYDGVRGSISISSEYYESEVVPDSDKILLDTFGSSYDDDLNRAVSVYLRYLADLTPEHQQVWKSRELTGEYKLHPDYYRNTIIGDWGEGISIFNAFLLELQTINKMSDLMGRPPLFRKDFDKEDAPRAFSFIVRPTKKEYHDFVLLLDKLMSENINRDFFQNEVPYEWEEELSGGRIEVRRKGSIQILDDWLSKNFRPQDPATLKDMIPTFREVRRKRQRPAHALEDNTFDQEFIHKQRELIIRAYDALRTLRLVLANHPALEQFEAPSVLNGDIWTQ